MYTNRMRHKKTKSRGKSDEFELLCELGNELIKAFGEVRYVETIARSNGQWTRNAYWQKLESGNWIDIDWIEFHRRDSHPK